MLDIDTTSGDVITSDFDAIPSGWYLAQVIEAATEQKDNGVRLNLTWEILEGPSAKRRVWQREWAQHSSPGAQEIGQRMIRTLGQAMGVARVDDAAKLQFIPVEVRIGLEKKQEGYEQRNEIKTARKAGSGGATTTQVSGGANASSPAGAGGSAPWRKAS